MRSRRVLIAVAAKLGRAFLAIQEPLWIAAVLLVSGACSPRAHAQPSDEDFAHPYEFEHDFAEADDVPAWERSGPLASIGMGGQYSGFGLQLAYEWVHSCSGFSLAPYASAGLYPGWGLLAREHTHPAFAVGTLASLGARNRWLLDLGVQPIAGATLYLGGTLAAERPLYGPTLQLGRQWMGASGIFFRLLAGAGYVIDPYIAGGVYFALSFGGGWKP